MLSYFNFLAGIALMLLGVRSLRKGTDRVFGARFSASSERRNESSSARKSRDMETRGRFDRLVGRGIAVRI